VGDDSTRGRPRDPAVGAAALRETLDLLDKHGYDGLRVAEVARSAGIGLGSLYRRWPTKYALVVDALRDVAADHEIEPTDDPVEDLVAGLVRIAAGIAGRAARLLSVLMTDPESELATAVREAKVAPILAANRERLRRAVGDVPNLEIHADAGPSLIFMHLLVHGSAPDEKWLRAEVLPVLLGATRRTVS
jgi:AcrR family transcriptional regulator